MEPSLNYMKQALYNAFESVNTACVIASNRLDQMKPSGRQNSEDYLLHQICCTISSEISNALSTIRTYEKLYNDIFKDEE